MSFVQTFVFIPSTVLTFFVLKLNILGVVVTPLTTSPNLH